MDVSADSWDTAAIHVCIQQPCASIKHPEKLENVFGFAMVYHSGRYIF